MCLLTTVVASRLPSNYFDDSKLELRSCSRNAACCEVRARSSLQLAGFIPLHMQGMTILM